MGWEEEVVSEREVVPREEVRVEDVREGRYLE